MFGSEARSASPILSVDLKKFDLSAEEYIATTAGGWSATPLKQQRVRAGVLANCWQVGPCMFIEYDLGPYFFEATNAHVQNGGPVIVFEKILSGFEYGRFAGEDHYAGADTIILRGQDAIRRQIATATRRQELYISKQSIGLNPNQALLSKFIAPNTLVGRILHAEWDGIFESLKNGATNQPQSAVDRLAAALKVALGVNPQREDVRAEARELLFRQIQRFVGANLDHPDLNTTMILSQYGVSRASLYRMFESMGGVRNYITELRTSKALLDVFESGRGYGAIRSAQDRWRFSSQPNFNRAVNRLFGNSPKKLLSSEADLDISFRLKSDFAADFLDNRWGAPAPDLSQMVA
ncbi:MAG: hypothetical protein AAFQ12_00015 [Pseudomonadota bacterium]